MCFGRGGGGGGGEEGECLLLVLQPTNNKCKVHNILSDHIQLVNLVVFSKFIAILSCDSLSKNIQFPHTYPWQEVAPTICLRDQNTRDH